MYSDVVRQGVPERFAELIRKLDAASDVAGESGKSANLVRNLEIKTLADRIFGDEEKAEAWLHRPNASLSGQRPMDLLKDELGTAVVREIRTLGKLAQGSFQAEMPVAPAKEWKLKDLRYVVFVQEPSSGRIAGAASLSAGR